VTADDARAALEGTSEPARLLRSIVNPSALGEHLELEIERYARTAAKGWFRPARFELAYDIVTVRAAGLSRSFHEIALHTTRHGRPSAERLSRAMSDRYALRALTIDRRERGEQMRAALESESLARGVGNGRWVMIAALDGQSIATLLEDGGARRRLPAAEGSGEDACRHLMRRVLGSSVGELHLLTTTPGEGRARSTEVWIVTRVDRSAHADGSMVLVWEPVADLLARVGTPEIIDPTTLATLAALSRSELLPRLMSLPSAKRIEQRSQERSALAPAAPRGALQGEGPLLDGNASLLAFNARVLALAEDDTVPLLERFRYLAIVAANMDEFFSVQVGSLKYEGKDAVDESDGQNPVDQRLAAVARQVRALVVRQHDCEVTCLRLLEAQGVRVRVSGDLTNAEREHLHAYFRSTIFPYLTPRAITATPGHSLPIVADRALSFAVGLREVHSGGPLHLAELAVPQALPRFVPLPGGADYVPLEDVIRRALPLVYPGRRVEHAHLFRVTRYADLGVDEQRAGNLTQAIDEHAQRRKHQPVVRIEVEQGMPVPLRDLLLRELQLEPGSRPGSLGTADVYEVPGLLDLEGFRQLAELPMPTLAFPPFRPRQAVPASKSLWEAIREQDVLLHHPYDDFSTSVARFFNDAADDQDVPSIKVTLYRAGERSPIVDALRRAASAGKDVTVFVELKARFDEQRNVRWTRQLEASGAHVVQGLPGYKNHSKVGLVVRREGDVLRRYAHIGTGNYNAGTARVYTDLGLLTCRAEICDDVTDLFNTLTGSSVPTNVAYRECLVAPHALLPALLARIDREAQHARAGRGGRIRMKLNGLSERAVVQALYRAAQAGVAVDLVVRSLCTLQPGLHGVSERIRVVSVLGRFLEHARIYYFANDGAPEYFIGSADARPRNLHRRVELLAPIHAAPHRARLDEILDIELSDPTAWTLESDGSYVRRGGTSPTGAGGAQSHFAAEAEASHKSAPVTVSPGVSALSNTATTS
jgi:polyphosphate kinase